MNPHLTDDALVELVESGVEHAHLTVCASCRARVEDARHALCVAADVDVPEPSPLFWDHFSSRVREGLDDAMAAAPPRPAAWWRRLAWRPLWAAGVLVVGAVLVWHAGHDTGLFRPVAQQSAARATTSKPETGSAAVEEQDTDSSWMFVTEAASDVDLDSALQSGFALGPDSAEAAVAQLSQDEQRELVRLLQASVAGAGSE